MPAEIHITLHTVLYSSKFSNCRVLAMSSVAREEYVNVII